MPREDRAPVVSDPYPAYTHRPPSFESPRVPDFGDYSAGLARGLDSASDRLAGGLSGAASVFDSQSSSPSSDSGWGGGGSDYGSGSSGGSFDSGSSYDSGGSSSFGDSGGGSSFNP